MPRGWILAILCCLSIQEAGDSLSEKAKLHEDLASAAEGLGDQLLKSKAWDEARAFLELIRAKSDARADALDKLIAKTDKQTSGLKWDAKVSDLVKNFGRERAKGFFAFAKAWKAKDAEAARWTEAEAEILDDLLDYVKAYARLTQIRSHYELPKTRFDWKLSVPAVWHAKYKLLNPREARELEGKVGFTIEGKASAENSITSGRESLTDLQESTIHAPFYRNYLLHPALNRFGLGQAKGNSCASVIDIKTGLGDLEASYSILSVPRNRAVDVPVTGYDNYSPIFDGKTMRQLGYPISLVIYEPTIHPKDVRARLTLDMKEVEIHLSTPENPVGSTVTPSHKSTILIVAKEPLKPGSEYKISIRYQYKGEETLVEWSFKTAR